MDDTVIIAVVHGSIGICALLYGAHELFYEYIICNCTGEGEVIEYEFSRESNIRGFKAVAKFLIGDTTYTARTRDALARKSQLPPIGSTVKIKFNPSDINNTAHFGDEKVITTWMVFAIGLMFVTGASLAASSLMGH